MAYITIERHVIYPHPGLSDVDVEEDDINNKRSEQLEQHNSQR